MSADQNELLAIAGESLNLLPRLAASLLDAASLQAGARVSVSALGRSAGDHRVRAGRPGYAGPLGPGRSAARAGWSDG
jgi:hypothetical protein